MQIAWFGRAVLVLASFLFTGTGHAKIVNQVVATVDGDPITAFELDTFIRASTGGIDPAMVTDSDRRKALDILITDALIRRESARLGLSASESEVDAYVNQIKQQNRLSDEDLEAALRQQGLTLESYRAQIKKEILKNQLISRQIRQRVNISPEEVQRYYDAHPEEFSQPAAIKVRHIFIALPASAGPLELDRAMNKVKQVQERLQAGEDYEDVARDLSEGPEADEGGLIGELRKGQMLPQLEEVAFQLKTGEVSEPVRSPAGIHILRVDEREEESRVDVKDVQDQIKERLYAEAIEARFQRWIEKDLREGHTIVIRQ